MGNLSAHLFPTSQRCRDCGKWNPYGERDAAKRGFCPQWGMPTAAGRTCHEHFEPFSDKESSK